MTITTYFSKSKGAHVPIKGMTYPQLVNTIRTVERDNGGGPSELLEALRAELASRPAQAPGEAADKPADGALVGGGLGGGGPEPEIGEVIIRPARAAAVGLERADQTATTSRDNGPPDDAFIANLSDDHEKLLTQITDHEIAAASLPQSAESDADVDKITAWVVRARKLYSEAEATRAVAKAPHLENCRKIDGFFSTIKDNLTTRAKSVEARCTAFLKAKRAREQADRDAEAARLRQEQLKRDEEARLAREAEQEASRKAREAEQAIRDAADADSRRKAEEASRAANRAAQHAAADADAASHDAAKADKSALKAEKKAEGVSLDRTGTSAGAVKLKMVPKFRIVDAEALKRSMGAIGPFLSQTAIDDALARGARADAWPRIPGVHFFEEEEVATTATRS